MGLWLLVTIFDLLLVLVFFSEKSPRGTNLASYTPSYSALAKRAGYDFNPVLRGMGFFFLTIFAVLCLFGACFVLFPDIWWSVPIASLVLLMIMYVVAEGIFLWYFFRSNDLSGVTGGFRKSIGTNLLKGWGGETFAEFSNSIGIMVVVGIDLIFEAREGSYWWAGQLAALVSVMSAAAWVQRYVLEGPEKLPLNPTPAQIEDFNKPHSRSDYFWKTFPNLFAVIASVLTAMAVLIPTSNNNTGRTDASIDPAWILWPWLIVFFIWGVLAIIPCFRSTQPWRVGPNVKAVWKNRENLDVFLIITFIFAGGSFFIIALLQGGNPSPDWVGWILGLITAASFVVSQALKVNEQRKERVENPALLHDTESTVRVVKDSFLTIFGVVLLGAQTLMIWGITQQWLQDSIFKTSYQFILGLMVAASLAGVFADSLRMVKNWDREIVQALSSQTAP